MFQLEHSTQFHPEHSTLYIQLQTASMFQPEHTGTMFQLEHFVHTMFRPLSRGVGGWPMLLISLASPTQWGAPSFAPLAKGGSRKRRHQVGSITCAQQNHIAQAAWPPTLAKNARMGHPQRERCTQRSIKGGPPAHCPVLREARRILA
jgi:hypothetical protein